MKTDVLPRVLRRKLESRLPVLLVSEPGVGKSDIVHQVTGDLDYDLLLSHPVVEDVTDPKGLPFPHKNGKEAMFLPFGILAQALAATRPTVWFLDDLGQAAPEVQAAYMQLLLARRVGEHKLPDWITFVAATNRKQDRAGVFGMLEPVKSRFVTILNVEPSLEAWINWAFENAMPPELIAFLQLRGEDGGDGKGGLFFRPEPTTELVNGQSPRTWHNAGKLILSGLDEEEDVALEELSGAVGAGAATEFMKFLRVWPDLVSIDEILLNPMGARIPQEPDTMCMVSTALATRATAENFRNISKYAKRIAESGQGEFAAFLVRSSARREPKVAKTAAYTKLLTDGPMKELLQ